MFDDGTRKLTRAELDRAKPEYIKRLCVYLNIPEGSDNKKSSLINWLVFEGYCYEPSYGGWH